MFIILPLFSLEKDWYFENENFSIQLSVPSRSIIFGEPMTLNATLKFPSNFEVDVNELISQLLWYSNPVNPSWDLLDKKIDISENSSGKQLSLRMHLSPMKKGFLYLSWLKISFHSKDSSHSREFFTPIFKVEVLENSLLSTDLNPNLELMAVEPRYFVNLDEENTQVAFSQSTLTIEQKRNMQVLQSHSFPWLFTLLCILGSAGFLFWKFFLSNQRESKRPTVTLREQVLIALEKLNQKSLIEKDSLGPFYGEIGAILKYDLEKNLKIPVLSMTTQEFLNNATFLKLSPSLQTKIKEIFSEIDAIKYSAITPSSSDSKELYNKVKEVVQILD